MKKIIAFTCLMVGISQTWAAPVTARSDLGDQAGYSLGYLLAKNNADAMRGLDLDAFIQGLTAASNQQTPALSNEQMSRAINEYRQQAESAEFKKLKQQAQTNIQAEQKFLIANAKQPQVIKTTSGLQYTVLKAGSGQIPQANSTVTINYEGRLLDDTVFDSSIARQQPITLNLVDVIPGLQEGLKTMKEGGKTRFFIPSTLGYGDIGSGDAIQPNSLLIFDVELIKVEK